MKYLTRACTALLLSVLGMSALAQPPAAARPVRFERRDETAIYKDLGLSQAQIGKIDAILKKYRAAVRTALGSKAAPDETRKKVSTLRSKAAADIGAVLTPAQRQKAEKNAAIESLLGRRRAHRAGFAALLEQLNLSAAQKTKIKAMLDDSRAKRKAIEQDRSLREDRKRAKQAEIRKQTTDKINAVLTKDQKAKLEKLLKEQRKPSPPGGRPGPALRRPPTKGAGA